MARTTSSSARTTAPSKGTTATAPSKGTTAPSKGTTAPSKGTTATAPTAPATAPTAPATASGPYRSNAEWHAAHAAAVGALRAVPTARAALQVATHLAWKAPAGAVAWHKGTNPTMLGHAEALGVQVGMPIHEAMGLCLAALPEDHEQADALRAASAALLA